MTPPFTAFHSILLTPYCEQTHQSDEASPSLPSQSWSSLCHPSDCSIHLCLINSWCCCTKVNEISLTLKIQHSITAHTKYYVIMEFFNDLSSVFVHKMDQRLYARKHLSGHCFSFTAFNLIVLGQCQSSHQP